MEKTVLLMGWNSKVNVRQLNGLYSSGCIKHTASNTKQTK